MTKETKTGVFKKWATVENKPIQEAKKFEFFEDEVLIQIFVKYPSNLTLVGADGSLSTMQEKMKKVFPIAKVIAVGKQCSRDYKVGDLVSVPDIYAQMIPNAAWRRYMETRDDTAKQWHGPIPEHFIPLLEVKWEMNQFFLNKLGPQKDHQRNIYLVPTSQTKCRVNGLV